MEIYKGGLRRMAKVRCPLCSMETTEFVVNQHLDRGCPTTPKRTGSALHSAAESKHSSPIESGSPEDRKRALEDTSTMEPKKTKLSPVPLAEQVRPMTLDDYIGQADLVGKNGLLRKFVENDACPSIILWGPSGVGKTSFARVRNVCQSVGGDH